MMNKANTSYKASRRYGLVYLLLFHFVFLFSSASSAADDKIKIAILDFKHQGSNFSSEDMGAVISEWLITAFVQIGRFDVIERRLLGQIVEEQKMTETGLVSSEGAVELGKLLGVRFVVTGSVIKLGDVIEINARVIDVQDGTIIAAESTKSTSVAQLHAKAKSMASRIIKKFPLEGYVVYRNGENIDIDLGRQSGVNLGMVFSVLKEGEKVSHPKTGEYLYTKQIRVGIIKVAKVRKNISTAVVINETEEGIINYGHLVKNTVDVHEVVKNTAEVHEEPTANVTSSANDQIGLSVDRVRLIVDAEPSHARIRIVNIGPRYHPGIELTPGTYKIEVSASGYATQMFWKTLPRPGEHRISVRLEEVSTVSVESRANIQITSRPGKKQPKPIPIHQQGRYSCSDLRERESFSGTMGFRELSVSERHYLDANCR